MSDPIAKAMNSLLVNFLQNTSFVAQISADVSALKSVVSALGPEVRSALEEQVALERSKMQQYIEDQQKTIAILKSGIQAARGDA
ncbi:MAG: hypothetical protein WA213_11335 [Terriglobales bacterium]